MQGGGKICHVRISILVPVLKLNMMMSCVVSCSAGKLQYSGCGGAVFMTWVVFTAGPCRLICGMTWANTRQHLLSSSYLHSALMQESSLGVESWKKCCYFSHFNYWSPVCAPPTEPAAKHWNYFVLLCSVLTF